MHKNEFMDHIVNNIQLIQNLTCDMCVKSVKNI